MKIARIICWLLDSTLRPTMNRGFDIIPACAGFDIICEFLTPGPRVRGGLGWGKKLSNSVNQSANITILNHL